MFCCEKCPNRDNCHTERFKKAGPATASSLWMRPGFEAMCPVELDSFRKSPATDSLVSLCVNAHTSLQRFSHCMIPVWLDSTQITVFRFPSKSCAWYLVLFWVSLLLRLQASWGGTKRLRGKHYRLQRSVTTATVASSLERWSILQTLPGILSGYHKRVTGTGLTFELSQYHVVKRHSKYLLEPVFVSGARTSWPKPSTAA